MFFVGLSSVVPLRAQFIWSNGGGNNIVSSTLNWAGGVVPGLGADVTFGGAGTPVVNLDASPVLNSITFSGTVGYGINTSNASTITLTGGGTSGITNNTSAGASILVNVPLILAGDITVSNTASATTGLLMSGNLSGAGNITITNSGTQPLQFSGVDSRTSGSITITAGTFTVGNGISTSAMILGNVANSGQLSFFTAPTAALNYTGIISGTAGFNLNGSNTATLTLSGANTYSGVTFVNNGTLADGIASAFSSNSQVQVSSGATLAVNHNETIGGLRDGAGAGTVNLGSGVTLTVNTTGVPGPLSGTITGAGGLVTGGAGTMTLSGANTYDGGTVVSTGTLVVNNSSGSATGSGNVTVNSGATFQVGAIGVGTAGAISGNVIDNGTLSFGDTVTFGETISGSGVMVVSSGANVTLTGSSNNYAGFTNVNGTLADGTLNPSFSPNSVMIVNSAAGHLTVNTNETIAGLTNGGSGGPVSIVNGGTALTINTSTLNPTPFAGVISGLGNLALSGGGSLGLSAVNTYSGTTSITGTNTLLFLTGTGTGTGVVTIGSGATLEFGNVTGGSSAGSVAGNIVDNGTLTLNLTGINTVGNTISGSGSLTKLGVSTITLTGANTYANGTSITGTLFAANSSGSATGTGPITINVGGNLEIGTVGGSVGAVSGGSTITDSGSLTFNLTGPSSFGNTVSGAGGLGQYGSGTLTLTGTGTKTYTGQTLINSGTITDAAAGDFAPGSVVSFNTGTLTANFAETVGGLTGAGGTVSLPNSTNLTVATTGAFTFGGTVTGAGGIIKSGTGSETLSGTNNYSGGTAVNAGILFVSNATGSGTGSGAVTIASGATFQIGANGGSATGSAGSSIIDNGTFNFSLTTASTFANTISGTGILQDLNIGTLTFLSSGANTYSGSTVISAGTIADGAANAFSPNSLMVVKTGTNLQVNFNETIGGLTGSAGLAGAISIASGAVLTELNNVTRMFPGPISGLGGLTVGGTATTILPVTEAYTGITTINSGATLQLGNSGGTSATLSGTVVDNGVLNLNEGSDTTYSSPTSGSGSLVVNGGANITIPNANSYTGGTTINSGTIFVTNSTGSALGSGAVVATSATPTVIGSGGFIGGSGRFSGTLTLNGGSLVFPINMNSVANTVVPATLSTGPATFGGTAGLIFAMSSASGVAGTNWSLLSISGGLNITATSGNQFMLSLNTLDPGTSTGGLAANFNPTTPYSWEFVTTTGGITGFAANEFSILLTTPGGGLPGFQNNFAGGGFFVTQSGNDLFLNFTPVPEPSTWALLLAGSAMAAVSTWRRKKRS